MRVTDHIRLLRIPFQVMPGPATKLDRFVNVLVVDHGGALTVVDTGVAGSEGTILAEVEAMGRRAEDIARIVLSHSHPDHIGAAKTLRELARCPVLAHSGEAAWIEDPTLQARERPIPGFERMVAGPVPLDRRVEEGDAIGDGAGRMVVLHTPGHSSGSISLHFPEEEAVFTGDLLPVPRNLPIYEDPRALVASVRKVQRLAPLRVALSSWAEPTAAPEALEKALWCVQEVHRTVRENIGREGVTPPLCEEVLRRLGVPAELNIPLVARTVASHLPYLDEEDITA